MFVRRMLRMWPRDMEVEALAHIGGVEGALQKISPLRLRRGTI